VTSKLKKVLEALKNNDSVVIVGTEEKTCLPVEFNSKTVGTSHTVDIFVAPKVGLYNPGQLQTLIMSLVPGLIPTCKDSFSGGMDKTQSLSIGVLYFDETFGEIEIEVYDDSDYKQVFNEATTEKKLKRYLRRRTWVRLYPDIQIGEKAFASRDLKNAYQYMIPPGDLKKSRKGKKLSETNKWT